MATETPSPDGQSSEHKCPQGAGQRRARAGRPRQGLVGKTQTEAHEQPRPNHGIDYQPQQPFNHRSPYPRQSQSGTRNDPDALARLTHQPPRPSTHPRGLGLSTA